LIRSRATRRFWRLYSELPPSLQGEARHAFRLFEGNPSHPSLQFKKLAGMEDVYSARISLDCRALAVMEQDGLVWFWIGSHAEYDKLP